MLIHRYIPLYAVVMVGDLFEIVLGVGEHVEVLVREELVATELAGLNFRGLMAWKMLAFLQEEQSLVGAISWLEQVLDLAREWQLEKELLAVNLCGCNFLPLAKEEVGSEGRGPVDFGGVGGYEKAVLEVIVGQLSPKEPLRPSPHFN